MGDNGDLLRVANGPTLQDYIDRLNDYYGINEQAMPSRWRTKIIVDCGHYLPASLRHTPVSLITPEMLQEAVSRICRLGGKRYQAVMCGLRDCFAMATMDDAITVNPALHVHIRELNSTSSPIDEALYDMILERSKTVPGGRLFVLAGFADTSISAVAEVTREQCDGEAHTMLIRRGKKQRLARIADPDGIAVFEHVLRDFETRMEDEDYARNNTNRLICTNRFGLPYERKQLNTIVELLRDACESPNVDIASFRKYVRYRQL